VEHDASNMLKRKVDNSYRDKAALGSRLGPPQQLHLAVCNSGCILRAVTQVSVSAARVETLIPSTIANLTAASPCPSGTKLENRTDSLSLP